jgi:hypothetical protein
VRNASVLYSLRPPHPRFIPFLFKKRKKVGVILVATEPEKWKIYQLSGWHGIISLPLPDI